MGLNKKNSRLYRRIIQRFTAEFFKTQDCTAEFFMVTELPPIWERAAN